MTEQLALILQVDGIKCSIVFISGNIHCLIGVLGLENGKSSPFSLFSLSERKSRK